MQYNHINIVFYRKILTTIILGTSLKCSYRKKFSCSHKLCFSTKSSTSEILQEGKTIHSNLPHINQKHHYQFITFRTKDSTDKFVRKLLDANNIKTNILQYKIDEHLDSSKSGAYLNGDVLEVAKKYILETDEKLCKVLALSIMPNHIHILLIQNDDLAKIIQQIKGGLAFLINKKLNQSRPLWQKDYFDKAIRDEKHFNLTYEYIKNNAMKAGLVDANIRFYGLYE